MPFPSPKIGFIGVEYLLPVAALVPKAASTEYSDSGCTFSLLHLRSEVVCWPRMYKFGQKSTGSREYSDSGCMLSLLRQRSELAWWPRMYFKSGQKSTGNREQTELNQWGFSDEAFHKRHWHTSSVRQGREGRGAFEEHVSMQTSLRATVLRLALTSCRKPQQKHIKESISQ